MRSEVRGLRRERRRIARDRDDLDAETKAKIGLAQRFQHPTPDEARSAGHEDARAFQHPPVGRKGCDNGVKIFGEVP